MLESLQYLIDKWRHPTRGDFLAMGMGIKARSVRCRDHWAPHLRCSKEFQYRNLVSGEFNSVSVLGAGRLLDVDLTMLKDKFSSISFWDADPSLQRTWQKFANTLRPEQRFESYRIDLTGCIDSWTLMLDKFLQAHKGDLDHVAEFIASLECNQSAKYCLSSDVIISGNILSQLPLYWRDRAHHLILERWHLETDDHGNFGATLDDALHSSYAKLQRQHLERLECSTAKMIILTSDIQSMYYTCNLPLWQIEPLLFIDKEIRLNNFRIVDSDQWFWHIAPQGIEQADYGIIHGVKGWAFTAQERITVPGRTVQTEH